MEDALPLLGCSSERTLLDAVMDLDLIYEPLSGGYWLDTADCPEILQLGTPTYASPFDFSGFSPVFEFSNSCLSPILPEFQYQDGAERPAFLMNLPSDEIQVESFDGVESLIVNDLGRPRYSIHPGEWDSRNSISEQGTWWIRPRGPIVSVEERLMETLNYLKDSQRYGHALVQIWVPIKRGDRRVLTTYGQPFSLDTNCKSLVNYRGVSTGYQFSAEEDSNEAPGLPGRVFLGRVPEWTPDVQYFSSHEYPRVNHAQRYDVRGTIALPIFEQGSQSCLGVMEVVTTAQKINYGSDLENICNALQAVNLRSSEILSIPCIKVSNESYQGALPEIREVLRTVCNTHRLPLAQTWIPCIQQGKRGSRHSDENYRECVSTVDDACYVSDPSMLGFHEACSEHHLFRGQGVAGKAFTTNQPCFSTDITTFSKIEYPLSHHAKLFHLRAAVAIRLQSTLAGVADFVLEFFLPVDCRGNNEQKLMLNSLSTTIQQACHNLRVVSDKELEFEGVLQANELSDLSFDISDSGGGSDFLSMAAHKGASKEESSCIANIVETQHKDSFPGDLRFLNAGKATKKRHTKNEKTVSLQVLRQYFSGSLKDAAKIIGVSPTTLKRICRQHGITRWPSRKIKKVDHSLRKLQVVIDSVQGAEGAFQFSSLYENFTKASGPDKKSAGSSTFSALKQKYHPESIVLQQEEARFTVHTSASNSHSSSCSQSSSSSIACSSGTKQRSQDQLVKHEAFLEDNQSDNMLKRAYSQTEVLLSTEEPPRSMARSLSHKFLGEHILPTSLSPPHNKRDEVLKVKAMYGEEKVRFKLQPIWSFQDLKQEIVKRFSFSNIESVDLKYLDDDAEWVLLTCDADLQECIDVYKLSHAHTIKISVHHVAQTVSRASTAAQHCDEYV